MTQRPPLTVLVADTSSEALARLKGWGIEAPLRLVLVGTDKAELLRFLEALSPGLTRTHWDEALPHERWEGGNLTVDVVVGDVKVARQWVVAVAEVVLVKAPADVAPWRFLCAEGVSIYASTPTETLPGFLEQTAPNTYALRGARLKKETLPEHQDVVIVGAGLSGALCAYYFSKAGFSVTVIDERAVPAAGASALYAGLIHPHWQKDDGALFSLTRRGYREMLSLLENFPDCFDAEGVLDMAVSDDEWAYWEEAIASNVPLALADELLQLVDRETAQALTRAPVTRGGWWFPKAGLVYASRLVRALLDASGAKVITQVSVRLQKVDGGYQALDDKGTCWAQGSHAVVAAAKSSRTVLGFDADPFTLSGLWGRISLLPEGALTSSVPITGMGYLMNVEGFTATGATYEPEDARWDVVRAHAHNLEGLASMVGDTTPYPFSGAYEGERAVAKDRLPLMGAGAMPETLAPFLQTKEKPELKRLPRDVGLWVCAGLGSRGLTWGALLAKSLVARATGRPGALGLGLENALDPLRFLCR